jgi:signal transduction histidine kinase
VAQESLTNIVRHAEATHVWIDLRRDGDELHLIIHDDGIRFDCGTVRRNASCGESFGLLGIQERVHLLGGRAEIQSQPGRGTTIHAWFPIEVPTSERSRI